MRKAMLIFILAPSAAVAQNTSSNCYAMGPTWHCDANTTPAPSNSGINIDWGNLGAKYDPNAFMKGYQQVQQMQRDREARQQQRDAETAQAAATAESQAQAEQERQRTALAQSVRTQVSDQLRSGHCDEAVATALQSGEIELATQAKAFCAAPTHK